MRKSSDVRLMLAITFGPAPPRFRADEFLMALGSRVQGVRCRSGRIHLERRAVSRAQDDGRQQSQGEKKISVSPSGPDIYAPQDQQLQQIVDKTIMEADQDGDGRLSFEEFAHMVSNTVRVSIINCSARFSLTGARRTL